MVGLERSDSSVKLGSLLCDRIERKVEPVVVNAANAPVQKSVVQGEKVDIFTLPAVRHFEMDLGAVLTWA